MTKRVLFIVPYPFNTAPSQRLKFEQYYQLFEQHGYHITYKAFFSWSFWKIVYKPGYILRKAFYTIQCYLKRYLLLFNVHKFDIIYVHLWGTPLGLPVYEWLLRRLSKKIVYDIDDLVYKSDASKNNPLSALFKTAAKINYLLTNADHLLVSTDKLYQYAKQYNDNITQIPATINTMQYVDTKPKDSAEVIIGWSGSHSTSKYLHLLDDVLRKVSITKNVKVMVMGDPNFEIEGVNIELVSWTADTEISSIMQFDIGLHPVPDEEWVYGKSGGKLVQYMAAGIPVVASAVGPNFIAIKEGYNGFLVKNNEEWIEKLTLLVTDAALRKQMGIQSRMRAEEVYSVKVNFKKYLNVLDSL